MMSYVLSIYVFFFLWVSLQSKIESGNMPVNEGGPAWLNNAFFNELNPGFWQAIDHRVEIINRYGLVMSMAIGIGRRLVWTAASIHSI